ncbi:hypothetical protein K432DRAFT_386292 [Lepidopterella palustris CBS 459.81]|uniref:Uncharacterized protein n=1 Tax=Lepidopterella palustris CBS 459.81 TaxID=1314670 RepID=A0A8E2E0T0_9PEZI|nr:hypothetical protein K432DRAFT_386292 [Lepidopterella palustris CBS 459.81]
MSFLSKINLPTPILIQAVGLVGLGLHMTFTGRIPWVSSSYPTSITPLALRNRDTTFLLGAVTFALGLTYFVTSYVPVAENQWLHASVPVRFCLSVLFFGRLAVSGRQEFSTEGYWELVGLGLIDLIGSISVGMTLGKWDGRVEGY